MPITTLRESIPSARPRTYCSTISWASRLRTSPARPEAQNGHATGQPTWLETHSVAPLPLASSRGGMCTASTVAGRAPPGNESRSFVVRSWATLRSSSTPERIGSASERSARAAAGSAVICA